MMRAVRMRAAVSVMACALGGTVAMAGQSATPSPMAIGPVMDTQTIPAMAGQAMSADRSGTGRDDQARQEQERAAGQRQVQSDRERLLANLPAAKPSEFQVLVQRTTGEALPIFGENLFGGTPSTFAPVTDVPVGPGYTLGPGDEFQVQMAGQVNQLLRLTVDRTGAVSIPGLGAVHVAGVTYGDLPRFLQTRLETIYRNFTVNVTLGALRTIQVFVVGEARQPGAYTVSSLSTLTNAIFASGGVLAQGSLRDIQVRRGDKTVAHFDLYALLLHGDKSKDIPLVSGDVIFIPVAGAQAAVLGSVATPAIYELRDEMTVAQVLALAGGETVVATGFGVQVESIAEHAARSLVNVGMGELNTATVRDGDILSVGSVTGRFRNAVTLRGNVANPGRYVWHPGMHVLDLIPNKEALITRSYWDRRNALGQGAPEYEAETAPVTGAGGRGAGGSGAPVPGALEVQGGATARDGSSVASQGGSSVATALTGGSNPFGAKTDIVLSAPDIYWDNATIERQDATTLETSLVSFNLGKLVLHGDASQNLELLPGDVITIFSKADLRVPSAEQTRYVRLEGEFNAVGVYSVQPGETLRGLLRRVGGFTGDAYLYGSEFTRESTRRVEEQRLREYADTLEAQIAAVSSSNQARALTATDQAAAGASVADAQAAVARLRRTAPIGRIVLELKPNSAGVDAVPDLALEDGDRFVVPRVPASVAVQGQVFNANAFVYVSGQRVMDYLRRAGGPDREADKKREFVLRADGSVVSQQYVHLDKVPMYPGDTIVVPPVLDKRSLLQKIVSIASVIGNVGVGAATLAILARD